LHLAQRGLSFGFVSAEDDEVIGVTHDAVSPLAHPAVESMQVEVGQEGADNATNKVANQRVRWGLRVARACLAPGFTGRVDAGITLVIDIVADGESQT
jgi:hypothetical protein